MVKRTPDAFHDAAHDAARPLSGDVRALVYDFESKDMRLVPIRGENISKFDVIALSAKNLGKITNGQMVPLLVLENGVNALSPVVTVVDDQVKDRTPGQLSVKQVDEIMTALPLAEGLLAQASLGTMKKLEGRFTPRNGSGLGVLRFVDPSDFPTPVETRLPRAGSVAGTIADAVVLYDRRVARAMASGSGAAADAGGNLPLLM